MIGIAAPARYGLGVGANYWVLVPTVDQVADFRESPERFGLR